MTVQAEIRSLASETLAVRAALSHVFHELKLLDPHIAEAIATGFENAVESLTAAGRKFDIPAQDQHSIARAIEVVKEMRRTTLRSQPARRRLRRRELGC